MKETCKDYKTLEFFNVHMQTDFSLVTNQVSHIQKLTDIIFILTVLVIRIISLLLWK